MQFKQLLPKSAKGGFRALLNRAGYDLVHHSEKPGSALRYPYARHLDFLEDVRARGFLPSRVVDIGANHGAWSRDVVAVFPDVRSLLVEPQEELADCLHALASGRAGWSVAICGAGGKDESRLFKAHENTFASTFLLGADGSKRTDLRRVEVRTLDSLVDQHFGDDALDMVKIDAEGLELEILAGGAKSLARTEVVLLEVAFFEFTPGWPRFVDLVSAMDRLGFSIYDFTAFERRPSDNALGLMDCAFVADSSPLRASRAW